MDKTTEIILEIENAERISFEQSFKIVSYCTQLLSQHSAEAELSARKIVIHVLNNWGKIDKNLYVVWADLIETLGFYPYIQKNSSDLKIMSFADDVRMSYFKSDFLKNTYLHKEQKKISNYLLSGKNIIAKNVILFDEKKGGNEIDFFDYSNIKGRSGRMMEHYVGRIFNFCHVPVQKSIVIDIPFYEQDPEILTNEILIAVYFPSNGKVKEAAQKRYQYTTVRGGGFVDELESKENRRSSGRLFKQEFHQYFRRETASIDFALCEEILWKELEKVNKDRINCISMLDNIKSVLGRESYGAYVERIMQNIRKEEAIRNDLQNQIEKIQETTQWFLNRMQEWRKAYQQFPWYVRLLKKFFCFKSKIQRWSFSFVNQAELSFLRRDMSIDEIEKVYMQKICDNDLQKSQLQEQKLCIDDKIEKLKSQKKEIDIKMEHLKEGYQNFEKYNVAVPEDSVLNEFDLCKLNDVLDRVRYAEFWLAVHYYESRWLKEDNPVSEKQKGKTFKNILDDMYHRIAMISPCMVMTFFMLPKQFWAYDGNDKKNYFMCNYIDLLVVDEAGQTSPEIAAASFSLAKKAVIVGDEEQIPPVWGTARALDIAMAISNGVIANKGEYGMLEENGLNCSQSSIMKMAALSCEFNKYKRGLFLSEHRRCYNEIITYCNKLVYEGKLEPKRGSFYAAEYNELRGLLPVMGFRQVTTAKSEKYGGSRRNREEAEAIIMWLQKKYEKILLCYSDKDGIEERGVLGIITPFKSQSFLIKNLIKRRLPEYSKFIDVGTVHTFQGAERKVILFSSVYGSEDGCYFINRAPDLMNVAVSRAKDSFLVFGDKECLTGGEKTAAGLLKKMVFVEGEELC